MIDRLNDRQRSQEYWQHWRRRTDTDRETGRQRNCGLTRVVNVAHIQTERHRQEGCHFLTPSQPWWLYQGKRRKQTDRAQELCERRGGRPGLPATNSPYGLCGRKVTLNKQPVRQTQTHTNWTHKTADNAEVCVCVHVCVCVCVCVCVHVCVCVCTCMCMSLSLFSP